jgi:hypothetical protein
METPEIPACTAAALIEVITGSTDMFCWISEMSLPSSSGLASARL